MSIEAKQFLTGSGRRVLTDDGRQGMGAVAGVGSSTERMQGTVAAAVFENCGQLDNQQLDDIISWIQLYKS
ncbi:TPA: hypothetical protein MB292_005248 [Klebsiella pneumoniae]|uniref:hypothetical protein n=1 Tax=Raoultella ornithinolytica TaxID=54291 RepID=UPI000849F9B6|nr:hypothetical protein [Raoultella ornithinolytica]EIV6184209.1 hypothetical protein [Klebsiella aerogenes]HBM3285456.1 hypothetical protein [Klebsiella oxytoca]HBT4600109.1 hypothetical protein [Klebsiella pneumoniae]AOO59799.1 hypothetical protein AN237_24890 [Raoultella ornithinolytica]HAT1642262.1 hypothetical protein [Raoultella ornithinolytica]